MALFGDLMTYVAGLFRSRKQMEQEKDRHQRQVRRRAELALEDLNIALRGLDKRQQDLWAQARDAMKSGEDARAQRVLVQYRGVLSQAFKTEQRRFVFEQSLSSLQMASTDKELTGALNNLTAVLDIDPLQIESGLANADMMRQEQGDVDKLWQQEYARHMEGVQDAQQEHVPAIEDLLKKLKKEVAGEGGSGEKDDKIKEGLQRVQKLMGERSDK